MLTYSDTHRSSREGSLKPKVSFRAFCFSGLLRSGEVRGKHFKASDGPENGSNAASSQMRGIRVDRSDLSKQLLRDLLLLVTGRLL